MLYAAVLIVAMYVAFPAITGAEDIQLSAIEQVGKHLFFDKNLSDPKGQSCATCHNPVAGWTGESSEVNAREAVYGELDWGRTKPTV